VNLAKLDGLGVKRTLVMGAPMLVPVRARAPASAAPQPWLTSTRLQLSGSVHVVPDNPVSPADLLVFRSRIWHRARA
jgi:hypothetical protein